jgi:hypothetical protein
MLTELASNGLSLLAGAITSKGKEVVEKTLGVTIPEDVTKLTPELVVQLKEKEMEHENTLLQMSIDKQRVDIEQEKNANDAVDNRWLADMKSDSWLAKNIRPMVLVYLLTAYTVFALMSAAGWKVTESYVSLLAQWGMLVMSAYFVGRTVEKVTDTIKGSQ